jgi:hypothetical protein
MAKSMNGQSSLFGPMTCEGSPSATSSPGSADGVTRSDSPAGPMIAPSGLEAARASRGAWRAAAKVPTIRAIFGQRGANSSISAALQSSLVSRLRVKTAATGSTLFSMAWKDVATPSGRLIFRLAASARRTKGTGYGSWPTPTANDAKGSDYTYANGDHSRPVLKLPGVAKLVAIADTVPMSTTSVRRTATDVPASALLAHWSTPTAVEQSESPAVKDARNARHRAAGKMKGVGGYKLSTQVLLASWATPTARDWRSDRMQKSEAEHYGSKGRPLARQVLHAASGPIANGSGTETESIGLLSPEHSRWLQGYPETWSRSTPTAMPSSRKSRRSSSKPTVKHED